MFSPLRTTGRRLSRFAGAVVAGSSVLVVLASASPAQAALVSTGACDGSPLSQPFSGWGDGNNYKPVPDGNFANGASGWTLSGARVMSGAGPDGSAGHLLALPPLSSALSPLSCVNASDPTVRFFARGSGLLPLMAVTLYYQSVLGLLPLPAGAAVLPASSWRPSAAMSTWSLPAAAFSGGTARVAFRFTEVTGTTQITGVYVDPRLGR